MTLVFGYIFVIIIAYVCEPADKLAIATLGYMFGISATMIFTYLTLK
jgi:hypothetical protein